MDLTKLKILNSESTSFGKAIRKFEAKMNKNTEAFNVNQMMPVMNKMFSYISKNTGLDFTKFLSEACVIEGATYNGEQYTVYMTTDGKFNWVALYASVKDTSKFDIAFAEVWFESKSNSLSNPTKPDFVIERTQENSNPLLLQKIIEFFNNGGVLETTENSTENATESFDIEPEYSELEKTSEAIDVELDGDTITFKSRHAVILYFIVKNYLSSNKTEIDVDKAIKDMISLLNPTKTEIDSAVQQFSNTILKILKGLKNLNDVEFFKYFNLRDKFSESEINNATEIALFRMIAQHYTDTGHKGIAPVYTELLTKEQNPEATEEERALIVKAAKEAIANTAIKKIEKTNIGDYNLTYNPHALEVFKLYKENLKNLVGEHIDNKAKAQILLNTPLTQENRDKFSSFNSKRTRLIIVFGTAGSGKSYVTEDYLTNCVYDVQEDTLITPDEEGYPSEIGDLKQLKPNDDYFTGVAETAPKFYSELFRKIDKIIVYDDKDSICSTPEGINYLKNVTGGAGDISKVSSDSAFDPYNFTMAYTLSDLQDRVKTTEDKSKKENFVRLLNIMTSLTANGWFTKEQLEAINSGNKVFFTTAQLQDAVSRDDLGNDLRFLLSNGKDIDVNNFLPPQSFYFLGTIIIISNKPDKFWRELGDKAIDSRAGLGNYYNLMLSPEDLLSIINQVYPKLIDSAIQEGYKSDILKNFTEERIESRKSSREAMMQEIFKWYTGDVEEGETTFDDDCKARNIVIKEKSVRTISNLFTIIIRSRGASIDKIKEQALFLN